MRTLSQALLRAIHAQETGEVILPLVKMSQENWDDPVFIVPNTEPVTHDGDEYLPLAFEIALPSEEEEGVPVFNWRADNTDRRMVQAIRSVTGLVQVRIAWVLASSPNQIEAGPYEVEMQAAEYDASEIRGTMSVDPILDMPFGYMTMSPKNAPALF